MCVFGLNSSLAFVLHKAARAGTAQQSDTNGFDGGGCLLRNSDLSFRDLFVLKCIPIFTCAGFVAHTLQGSHGVCSVVGCV